MYFIFQFNVAAFFVKERSVGSLMVTMPWKDGGCQIEVDGLEIVLTPSHGKFQKNNFSHRFRTLENDAVNGD